MPLQKLGVVKIPLKKSGLYTQAMMENTLRRMTKSKDDIIEDAVKPLLMQLQLAENLVHSNDTNSKESAFLGIMKEVEHTKEVLTKLVNWEGELVTSFSMIERHILNWIEDKNYKEIPDLSSIREDIVKLKKEVQITRDENDKKEIRKPLARSMSTYKITQEDEMSFIDTMKALDPHLRECLCSLSAFPESAVLKKRILIYWWIGLGLIPSRNDWSAEKLGEIFFDDLINKWVLLPCIYKKHNRVVDQCTIQPNIHKNLNKNDVSTAEKICKIQTNGVSVQAILNVDETHLKSDFICGPDKAVTHVAQIGQWHCTEKYHIEVDKTDFLKDLGPRLTYLSLRGISGITELPECIGKLENLVILDLRACHNLERLPNKMKSLNKLTHLDIWDCCLLDHMPEWISELSNLEVLKGFVIGSLRTKNQCQFRDLSKNLKNLKRLSIKIIREYKITQGELHDLEGMVNLSVLTIMWGIHEEKHKAETLKFSLPKNLEKLDLRCYPRRQAPELLNATLLKKLKRLYIRGGELAEIGKLDSNDQSPGSELQILRLRYLKNFETDFSELGVRFENLRWLEYEDIRGRPGKRIWDKESHGPLISLPI